MLKRRTLLPLILLALLATWGCGGDDSPVAPGKSSFQTMAEAGTAYINDAAQCPGTITAATLQPQLASYTVIDIRSAADFVAGHIPGAVNSSLATLLADLGNGTIPTGKPYVVACYSGQTAGHAKIAMEMLGYEVYTLAYGMSAWSASTRGPWDNATVNAAAAERNQLTNPETTNNNASLTTQAYPTLSEPANTVVQQRVATMLTNGFKGITYTTMSANLDDYFIVNYHALADYEGTGTNGVPGHIPGAFQFTPNASLGWGQMLDKLPTDKPIVVYCWTGQHSSQVAAYLNMLGYEAYSLNFGANKLYYDDLVNSKRWTSANYNDFALEVGSTPTAAFAAVAAAGATYINDAGQCPGTITAATLQPLLDQYTVIDFRSQADYDAGHIAGAVHSTLGTLMTDLTNGTIPTGKPYVVTCYSGQTAGHAKIAMEMLGYDVYTLAYGMSAWAAATRTTWDNATVSASHADRNQLNSPETTNNNSTLNYHGFPALAGEPATAVQTAVASMLAGGFKGITYSTILANPDQYFVVNYHALADYLGTGTNGVPGHIPGAFQFTPNASLAINQMLANLPTDMPIVVYCWTGQHSSQVAAYLNMLGYEAFSLNFGANKLYYDDLINSRKWTSANYNDFPLVPTTSMALSAR